MGACPWARGCTPSRGGPSPTVGWGRSPGAPAADGRASAVGGRLLGDGDAQSFTPKFMCLRRSAWACELKCSNIRKN